jgi:hypothetical protein
MGEGRFSHRRDSIVDDTPEHQRAAAMAANDAGQLAEAYRLWLPLAEAGDAEAQGAVGSLVAYSLYRFESFEQLDAGTGPTLDEATTLADRDRGGRFLAAASAAGFGPASFNLAGLYMTGYGGGTWKERKARATELYDLAHTQGFTAFGRLIEGGGPGQTYLDVMERYLIEGDESPPPEWWHADPDARPS